MAALGNFISLYGAIDAQGYKIPFNDTFLQDIQLRYISMVMLETTKDINGTDTTCFKIYYLNPKGLEYNWFYLPTIGTGFDTLAEFKDAISITPWVNATAVDITNGNFVVYANLSAINDAPYATASASVLLNDDLVYKRIYNVGTDTTDIYTTIVNNLQYDKITVDGDQMYAASYDYLGS